MNMKRTVRKQYQAIIDEAAVSSLNQMDHPKEGWIATVRKALGMSAAQLARVVGQTRANISAAERAEMEERTTLKTLSKLADAMGCKLVYGFVPEGDEIEDVIRNQARKKASRLVRQASTHMALEKQSLSDVEIEEEVLRLTDELISDMPSDFWEVD